MNWPQKLVFENENLPILKTVCQVKVHAIVKAPIIEQLFKSKKRVLSDDVSVFKVMLIEGRARFIIQLIVIIRAAQAIYGC